MIKCAHALADLDKMANDFYDLVEAKFDLTNAIAGRIKDEATPVFNYISLHLKSIILGRPNILDHHASNLSTLLQTAKNNYTLNHAADRKQLNAWVKLSFFSIFNYDYNHLGFAKRDGGNLAYQHAIDLNINTCPYCNALYTFTLKKGDTKTRPVFDHFISKSRHPYFALSFYNLIPACYVCNSNLKGSKPFLFSTHLHPFVDSLEGLFRFRTNIDSVDFLISKKDFKITLEPCPTATPAESIRAKRSSEVFAIEDRYNFHKDYAGEVIKKSYFYNNSTIRELLNDYTINGQSLFSSEAEIVELLLGNYLKPNMFHKRILSKLTKDIADEFKVNL